jgi:hypothetical protein
MYLESSSSTSLATLRRSDVDCAIPMEDLRRCCCVIDCGAVCLSFFVEADVDRMYDGTSSDTGDGVYDEADIFRGSCDGDR